MSQILTCKGQTLHPISTIFNGLPEGTMADMMTQNKDAALKTVGVKTVDRLTDRQTDTHTHIHTHTRLSK